MMNWTLGNVVYIPRTVFFKSNRSLSYEPEYGWMRIDFLCFQNKNKKEYKSRDR